MATAATAALDRLAMLEAKLKRLPSGRTLYFAGEYGVGDKVIEFSHDGVPYEFPPDGPSTLPFNDRPGKSSVGVKEDKGKYKVYDGTLTVYDRYGVDPKVAQEHRKSRTGRRPSSQPEANQIRATAKQIATHALRKVGGCGVTVLTGDPVEDEEAKKEAKGQWFKFKRNQCEQIKKNFERATAAFHADSANKGKRAPEMDEVVTSAQEWLDDYRRSLKASKKFECPANCGYRSDYEERIAGHVEAEHPLFAEEQDDPAPKAARGKR